MFALIISYYYKIIIALFLILQITCITQEVSVLYLCLTPFVPADSPGEVPS